MKVLIQKKLFGNSINEKSSLFPYNKEDLFREIDPFNLYLYYIMDIVSTPPVGSPIIIFGGKHHVAKQLIALFPKHDYYIEPLCGSATFLFVKPLASKNIINDLNYDIINFFKVLINPDTRLRFKDRLLFMIDMDQDFDEIKKRMMNPIDRTKLDVDRASDFYYMNRVSYHGKGINRVYTQHVISKNFTEIILRTERTKIFNRDFREFLDIFLNRKNEKHRYFFYFDPPYYPDSNNSNKFKQYKHNFENLNDHNDLKRYLDRINELKRKKVLNINFGVSYNKCEKIYELYKENYFIFEIQTTHSSKSKSEGAKRELNIEYFITNYIPKNRTRVKGVKCVNKDINFSGLKKYF